MMFDMKCRGVLCFNGFGLVAGNGLFCSVFPVVPSASAISEWCSCDNCTTLSLHIFPDSL